MYEVCTTFTDTNLIMCTERNGACRSSKVSPICKNVCMYVFTYGCVYGTKLCYKVMIICIRVHACLCMCTYACMCVLVCVLHVCMRMCVFAGVCIHIGACMYVHLHVHIKRSGTCNVYKMKCTHTCLHTNMLKVDAYICLCVRAYTQSAAGLATHI